VGVYDVCQQVSRWEWQCELLLLLLLGIPHQVGA
jgi:hypothetical protein